MEDLMQFPYVEIGARDVTESEGGATILIQFSADGPGAPDVSEQDVVDAVKAFLAQQPNVAVTAMRYSVATTTV